MSNLSFTEMLDYAMLAYSDTPTSNVFRKLHFEDCIEGIQYYVGQKRDRNGLSSLIISFRGTDTLKDLVTDMRFWRKRVPYDNCNPKIRIHSGFIDAYENQCARGKIHEYMTNDVESVYVTGHSYGGALALICALDLQYNFPKKVYDVVVFGCPRVGNRQFVRSYNKRLIKTIRFENGNDLVTKIPPALFGFRHAGVKIHIGSPRIFGFYSLRAHRVGNYYQHLWQKSGC